jgi:DNA-binding LacI/PurR family transcriptional regulator
MKGIDMGKKQASKMQIKNIADKLGLSVSTVSVVLNGRGDQVRRRRRKY